VALGEGKRNPPPLLKVFPSLTQLVDSHAMLPKSASHDDFNQLQETQPDFRVSFASSFLEERRGTRSFISAEPGFDCCRSRTGVSSCF